MNQRIVFRVFILEEYRKKGYEKNKAYMILSFVNDTVTLM